MSAPHKKPPTDEEMQAAIDRFIAGEGPDPLNRKLDGVTTRTNYSGANRRAYSSKAALARRKGGKK